MADLSLEELLDKATEAVRRDLNHIFISVSNSKLSPTSARDLVAYVKLLSDILDRQAKEAKGLAAASDDELKALARSLVEEK